MAAQVHPGLEPSQAGSLCVYLFLCNVYMFTCMYVCMCVYHIHIHICIYAYMHACFLNMYVHSTYRLRVDRW